ncbi:MAG TPA: amidohydrolase family protein [Desulfomonilaceae bacterium]|nr:amidohydrolase family protein [Desulfomonilaceae bacterium]
MIIDSHVHLLPKKVRENRTLFCERDVNFGALYSSPKARIASEDDILKYMDDSGIEKAVLFGFPWEDHKLINLNNDEIWDFHQRFSDRIIPFAVLSAAGGDRAHKETERTLKAGFKGIGELAMYHHGWSLADFEALGPSLELAQSAGVPVVIHVNEPVGHQYAGKIPVDFGGLVSIIRANPEVTFILAHFGGGIFVYGLMPEILSVFKRTYLDTAASPYLYDARVFEVACSIMGPHKILFGSDYPLLPLSRYLRQLDEANINGSQRDAILGGNMLNIIRERNALSKK